MQKLEWMGKLRPGDEVVYLHSTPWKQGDKRSETPIKITAVGRKSVFVGDMRFSKWNGYQVKSDGRPVNATYHFGKHLKIRPLGDDDKGKFDTERDLLVSGIQNVDYSKYDLRDLRWLQEQVRRLGIKCPLNQ